MTLREWAIKNLVDKGLFEDQAMEIMKFAKFHPALEEVQSRWDDDISGYQESLLEAIWEPIRHMALEWIKVYKPTAWYRPLFEE